LGRAGFARKFLAAYDILILRSATALLQRTATALGQGLYIRYSIANGARAVYGVGYSCALIISCKLFLVTFPKTASACENYSLSGAVLNVSETHWNG